MDRNLSVFDCSVIDLGKISFEQGNLTVVENANFPFKVQRVFYLYDIAVVKVVVHTHITNVISF